MYIYIYVYIYIYIYIYTYIDSPVNGQPLVSIRQGVWPAPTNGALQLPQFPPSFGLVLGVPFEAAKIGIQLLETGSTLDIENLYSASKLRIVAEDLRLAMMKFEL